MDANIWMLGTGRKVSPVHRLDRAASGVMIFSKTSDATRAAQFALSHPASIKEWDSCMSSSLHILLAEDYCVASYSFYTIKMCTISSFSWSGSFVAEDHQPLVPLRIIIMLSVVIKLSEPNSVAYLNRTPIFEWWVVMCKSKNGDHKGMCWKETGLRAQNLLTILGSIVNRIWGDLCGLLIPHCQWTLIVHNNSRLALISSGIDPGFFIYICERTRISTSQIRVE